MSKRIKLSFFLLVVLLSFFSFKHLLSSGYFPMHDDMQAMRVLQLDKCLSDGQIPCRWVPDMGYGYGYPQFIYYSPLPYYVMEIFHLIGFSILGAVKAGLILGFILSGISMFVLGKTLWGSLGGLVSSVFYIYAPYRASDIYSRGAVGEFWALVFLPLILWAIFQLIVSGRKKYLAYLSFSYAGLLLTHNLTSIAFTPLMIVWALFLLFWFKKLVFDRLLKLTLAGLWGIGLAAFFILPVIFERDLVHLDTMISGYFNYLAHFVSLKQLFWSSNWGYGSSELGPYDDLSFSIGLFHWLAALAAFLLVVKKRKQKNIKALVLFFAVVFIAGVFFTHQRSAFIWASLPFMVYFQFPWRFLVIAILAASILAGSILAKVKINQTSILLTGAMILMAVFLNVNYFHPSDWYNISDKEKFSGELWEKQLTISIFDYLPIFAQAPPSEKAPEQPMILSGKAELVEYEKGSNWQKGVLMVEDRAEVRLPFFYFPDLKVFVDSQLIDFNYDNDLGLVTFTLTEGKHEIYAQLFDTPVRQIGDYLSLVSFISLAGFLYLSNKDEKNKKLIKK